MPSQRCVVQGCDNCSDLQKGISIHKSPKDKKILAKWTSFVKTHRRNFAASSRFVICSEHFENECFKRRIHIPGSPRILNKDAIPTIWKKIESNLQSERDRRQVVKEILKEKEPQQSTIQAELNDANDNNADNLDGTILNDSSISYTCTETAENLSLREETTSEITQPENAAELCERPVNIETNECPSCLLHKKTIKSLKKEVYYLRVKLKRSQGRVEVSRGYVTALISAQKNTVGTQTIDEEQDVEAMDLMDAVAEEDIDDGEDDDDNAEDITDDEMDELNNSFDDPAFTDSEPELITTSTNADFNLEDSFNTRLDIEGKDVREEPKAIVFISKLLQLFQFCHLCLSPSPSIVLKQTGTSLTVETTCSNCKKVFSWDSQPLMLGKFAAGNLLLSFGILCAGASVKKILLVFKHINVLVYHESLYYYHQKQLLVPSVLKYWQEYQTEIVRSLSGQEVILAGDARHDSMGHSAKYGTYTIFCCDIGQIIYIELVQANEAGSSTAMEFTGHKKCFDYLLHHTDMTIKSFISDRHTSICKWMREELPNICKTLKIPVINHFYDLWHIGKKINKSLKKLSKQSGCELVGRWAKACVRHFYWSVTSTEELQGDVKLAKFEAFLYHITNQHKQLPNKLFNKCSHGPIQTNKVYFTKGSDAYGKLCEVLNKKSITAAIKKASPIGQTSCLEGFHSVVNQFAPKMLSFSYQGMLARTALAALHFNNNLRRESQVDDLGRIKLRVTYPKYKYGEATVREIKIPPNFDYVEEIYQCLTSTPRKEFKDIRDKLDDTTPDPRYTMLECENKEAAILKYKDRQHKENVIVPPTCTAAELQALTNPPKKSKQQRKAPVCKTCLAPRKGHKKALCRPNNQNV